MTKVTELREGYQGLIIEVEKHKMIIAAQSTLINKMTQTTKDLSDVIVKQTLINKNNLRVLDILDVRVKTLEDKIK